MDAALPENRLAASLRGFGPAGLAAIALILAGGLLSPLVSALLILVWARLSRTPWADLGFTPSASVPALLAAAGLGAIFKLLMKSVVMPLLGAPPVNATYHHLAGNTGEALFMSLAVILVAGFGEETFFRGFAFERLHKLLGTEKAATLIIVLFTTTWFALVHYQDQGVPGVEQALVTGAVFGTAYAWKRTLWPIMVAHAFFDLTAIAIIYFDLEATVAHWFF